MDFRQQAVLNCDPREKENKCGGPPRCWFAVEREPERPGGLLEFRILSSEFQGARAARSLKAERWRLKSWRQLRSSAEILKSDLGKGQHRCARKLGCQRKTCRERSNRQSPNFTQGENGLCSYHPKWKELLTHKLSVESSRGGGRGGYLVGY